jgi:CrcB protein
MLKTCTHYKKTKMNTTMIKNLLMVGFCGGFTTFSAFALENIHCWQMGEYCKMIVYTFASIAGSFAAVWLGTTMVK